MKKPPFMYSSQEIFAPESQNFQDMHSARVSRKRQRLVKMAAFGLGISMFGASVQAATTTYSTSTTGTLNWSTATWSTTVADWTAQAGNIVKFAGTAATTGTLNTDIAIGSLQYTGASGLTIVSDGSHTLTMNGTGLASNGFATSSANVASIINNNGNASAARVLTLGSTSALLTINMLSGLDIGIGAGTGSALLVNASLNNTSSVAQTLTFRENSVAGSSSSPSISYAGSIGVSGASIAIVNSGTGGVAGGKTSGGTVTISGTLGSSVASITQNSSTSKLIISGTNTSGFASGTGSVTINAGVLQTGGSNAFGAGNVLSVASSGTYQMNGYSQTIAGLSDVSGTTGGLVTNSGAAKTLTLAGSGTYSFTGSLTSSTAANLSIVKSGNGTQILSGNNTYTGSTAIAAGELRVNGSLASATVTGSVGGTLSGTGTLAGAITVSGTLAPGDGDTLGAMSISGSLTLNSTAVLAIKSTGSSAYDEVKVSGAVSLAGTLDLTKLSGLAVNDTITLIENTGSLATTGSFSSVTISGSTYALTYVSAQEYTVLISGTQYAINYAANVDSGSVANDVTLTELSVVPEPSTWAMLVGGIGSLLMFRGVRRRNS